MFKRYLKLILSAVAISIIAVIVFVFLNQKENIDYSNQISDNSVFGSGGSGSATSTIEVGFALYNNTVYNETQDEFVESGATIGRTQGLYWPANQTDNGDGTYSYNWTAVAGYGIMDTLMRNGQITPYVRFDTQYSGGPTVTGMTNYYFNSLNNPLALTDWIKTWVNNYGTSTHYYTFNNEPDYNFTKSNDVWNATAQNYVNSFIIWAKAIKEIDPNAVIAFNMTHADMNPNPDFNPYKGLDAMLELGAGNYIDAIDLHFYGWHILDGGVWNFVSIAESFDWDDYADDIQTRLTTYGLDNVELWIGESGVGTAIATSTDYTESVNVQSVEIVKQFVSFASQGFTKLFRLVLFDLTGHCGEVGAYKEYYYCSGVMTGNIDDPYKYQKKPSFNVFKKFNSLLVGTYFVATSTDTGILSYRFASSTADIYVGYANIDGDQTYSITLDRNYTAGKIIDAVGLYESEIAAGDLEENDVISTTTSTTTPKYLYLIK